MEARKRARAGKAKNAAIPDIMEGIPTRRRVINWNLERSDFDWPTADARSSMMSEESSFVFNFAFSLVDDDVNLPSGVHVFSWILGRIVDLGEIDDEETEIPILCVETMVPVGLGNFCVKMKASGFEVNTAKVKNVKDERILYTNGRIAQQITISNEG